MNTDKNKVFRCGKPYKKAVQYFKYNEDDLLEILTGHVAAVHGFGTFSSMAKLSVSTDTKVKAVGIVAECEDDRMHDCMLETPDNESTSTKKSKRNRMKKMESDIFRYDKESKRDPVVFKLSEEEMLEIVMNHLAQNNFFEYFSSAAQLLGTPGKDLRLVRAISELGDERIDDFDPKVDDAYMEFNGTHE